MKTHRMAVVRLSILIMSVVASTHVGAQARVSTQAAAKTPTQAYLEYVAAVNKARTLAEVLPHLSAEYRGMLESRPNADQPVWLQRLKDAQPAKDLKITKETISGEKCTLEGTGTSDKGNALKGKIMLVKEGGAWKLDEQSWST